MNKKPNLVIVIQGDKYFDFFKNEVQEIWPSHSIYFLVNYSGPIIYKFDYTKDIEGLTFPHIAEPLWKTEGKDTGFVWHLENKEVTKTDYSNTSILKSAEKIVYMSFLGVSLAIAFQVLIEQSLGDILTDNYLFCHPKSFDKKDILFSLNNQKTKDDPIFQEQLKLDTAKRYFEYNFNFNSCILFKSALTKAEIEFENFVFTKYVLQLFFRLQNLSDFSEHDVVDIVYNWKGTGLYPETGSPYSGTMIENLCQAGIIEDNGQGVLDNKRYDISKKGKNLFKYMSPDCKDIDQPGKLLQWQQNWPESKQEMDRYLIDFFTKQMEFMSSFEVQNNK
ncbi:hypothetical protein [Flavobacterium sp. H4147]|uniref:hypothetical protein n=1 Tax=Flavobacterium sp. H4147 TaxID=3034149 RepID=UPI0023EB3E55|nr:hypothetical protein [Flavobacterium sp. H4147]